MRTGRFAVAGLIVVWCVLVAGIGAADAQMFGQRQVGRPLARRPGPGALEQQQEVGTVQGSERFLRSNRSPLDFVGRDLAEVPRFVGMLQGRTRGQTPSSTQGLTRRVDRSTSVNQPALPAHRGMLYPPRLDISLLPPLSDQSVAAENAKETLARSPQLSGSSRIEVSLAGRTATLHGEVPSAADRAMAEVLLTFEPGISSIQNELQVNPQLQESENSLSALRRRQKPQVRWEELSHGAHSSANSQPSF